SSWEEIRRKSRRDYSLRACSNTVPMHLLRLRGRLLCQPGITAALWRELRIIWPACKTTEPLLFGVMRWTIPYSSFKGESLYESILTPQSAVLRFSKIR
ncbi:hypothetical protein HAX54_021378, partial [Datura stramonium]|nr:hypothetical protein [Datura stramonium]